MTSGATIILDTNFLLIPGMFGVDIFSEIQRVYPFKSEFAIMRPTLDELAALAQGRNRDGAAAKLGVGLIKAKNINTLPTAVKHADDAIVAAAEKLKKQGACLVATQDAQLRARLKKTGIRVIILRQKKYLTVL